MSLLAEPSEEIIQQPRRQTIQPDQHLALGGGDQLVSAAARGPDDELGAALGRHLPMILPAKPNLVLDQIFLEVGLNSAGANEQDVDALMNELRAEPLAPAGQGELAGAVFGAAGNRPPAQDG